MRSAFISPGRSEGRAVEVELPGFEGEEEGRGVSQLLAPVRQRPGTQDHRVL